MWKSAARLAFTAVAVLLMLAAFALAERGYVERQSFKAFYCAGVAVRQHRDPYRVEPLRTCERQLEPERMPAGYVEPAPLPGYALAPFALLSKLPPRLAAELFAIVLALAAVIAARCLAAVVPASGTGILLALAPLTLLNVAYGEIPPLALLALCASAYFLSRKQWSAAGCAAACALLQPNVGLPAVAAVFFFARRTRTAVLLTGLAIAALSIAVLGLKENAEYFRHVLPLLANAELVASDQYSLSRVLYVAGIAPALALSIGKIWFVCVGVLGVILAGVLAARRRQDDWLALLPSAVVLLFGIYLHDIQILIALPAALVVAARAPSRLLQGFGAAALAILAAVWTQKPSRAVLFLDAAGAFGGLFAVLSGSLRRRFAFALAGGIATTACVVLVLHFAPPAGAEHIVTHAFSASPGEFASEAWASYLRATSALTRPVFAPQLAAWLGLAGLLAGALANAAMAPTRRRHAGSGLG